MRISEKSFQYESIGMFGPFVMQSRSKSRGGMRHAHPGRRGTFKTSKKRLAVRFADMMLQGFDISIDRVPNNTIQIISKKKGSAIKAPVKKTKIIKKITNRAPTRFRRVEIKMLEKEIGTNIAKVSVPIRNRGVNGSKGVIKHMSLQDKGNSSIVTSQGFVKDNLHNQGTDFGGLFASKAGDKRGVAELLHNNSRDSILPLRKGKQRLGRDQITQNIAALFDNRLVEACPGKGGQGNGDSKINRVLLKLNPLPIRPININQLTTKSETHGFGPGVEGPGSIPLASKGEFVLEGGSKLFDFLEE